MESTKITTTLSLLLLYLTFSCTTEEKPEPADMVIKNGNIYTVNENAPKAEAVVVSGGKIIFIGSTSEAEGYVGEGTKEIDLEGWTMTPGFIEGHGHMMGLGYSELNLDLSKVNNYDELVDKVAQAVTEAQPGEWITGRGWHQSKWEPAPEIQVKGFQTHYKLSEVSPDNPVYLRHASGHAGFANAKAMEIAGVNQLSIESFTEQLSDGGEIVLDDLGNPTGIFNELAQGVISRHIPESTEEQDRKALELAIKTCQRNGITGFHDAGVGQKTIDLMQKFKEEGKLGVRMYEMITGRNMELVNDWLAKGPQVDPDNLLTVRSIKLNADGALGSRGAWLIEPYEDREGHVGFATISMDTVLKVSKLGLEAGFQVNTHAIGDRTNREVLDKYEQALIENPEKATDHRFRIEHTQHLSLDDIPRFGQLGVIASMQAIHMSSDRPWAIKRLGNKRIVEGAYVWQKLLQSGALIVNGTDVPVEPINPIASFFASVTRQTLKGTPEGGYEPDQKMTREQALKSYTLDCAYGEFAENIKGSIEVGKLADFTVFNQDIMTVPDDEILNTEVEMTILGGEIVYEKGSNL